ncbi:uncharacterized protein LOC108252348 [Diaphorina citri]|jgi:hypothetical protein|uniref:Uncharacterized protein LOC108252348 n=1 Tax=Diaphorina citri TaxID=121845 RepID=A0A1S4EBC7_DIACI|nr:uncharacterized protein LOC108252348 [Diaphorina citri]KAI5696539.1 hypothetical protein M8J75_014254 [Diaphorina citri]KAI5722754.1 hypothetical protein M8J76_013078 [Diaphorina citri]KAI5725687.1 hypothetical protein M8J77_018888 [Diaphorina citri]
MPPFFNLFVKPTDIRPSKVRPMASPVPESYEESEFEEPTFAGVRFLPRENMKTNISSVLLAALSHYLYGIFFNAYETVNSRYDYPNLGSMCFVLATALLLVRLDLSLKSLPIETRTWKYSVYKVLAVIFLTHLVLAGIWQQLVNLSWELFFMGKDCLDVLYAQTNSVLFLKLSELMTMRTAKWVTHLEGLAVLGMVLYSSAD